MRVDCDTTAMPSYAHPKNGEIPAGRVHVRVHQHGVPVHERPAARDRRVHVRRARVAQVRLAVSSTARCSRRSSPSGARRPARRSRPRAISATTYGWIDEGECLTFCDPNEAWVFEVVGPGKGRKGAIWAAQRVPDDHISVNANASRIRYVDLGNPDYYMASKNLTQTAQDSGWWSPADGPFQFCYAYDPDGRRSFAAIRDGSGGCSICARRR